MDVALFPKKFGPGLGCLVGPQSWKRVGSFCYHPSNFIMCQYAYLPTAGVSWTHKSYRSRTWIGSLIHREDYNRTQDSGLLDSLTTESMPFLFGRIYLCPFRTTTGP